MAEQEDSIAQKGTKAGHVLHGFVSYISREINHSKYLQRKHTVGQKVARLWNKVNPLPPATHYLNSPQN